MCGETVRDRPAPGKAARGKPAPQKPFPPAAVRHDHRMDTIVICNKDQMGHGDRELGQKVLGTFLKKSIALKDFTAIVFFNSGVRLGGDGSPETKGA